MLRANPKKTKSAPRLIPLVFLVFLGGIIAYNLFSFSSFYYARNEDERNLLLGTKTFHLEVAKTATAQAKGLSGRDSMPSDRGMLFDFGTENERCIWMKDMKFPIDIVWADSNKKVTAVNVSVSPYSYPTTYCKNAQYVVELNGGTLSYRGSNIISVGETINIQ